MKRISWGKNIDNMIKDNIEWYGFNTGIRKSVMTLNKIVHNNYRRRVKNKTKNKFIWNAKQLPITIQELIDIKQQYNKFSCELTETEG